MKQKIKEITNKIKGFFRNSSISKKEGLYIAIFIGICVILISGIVALKGVNADKGNEAKEPVEKEVSLDVPNDIANSQAMENSERVEKEKADSTKPVSTPKLSFINPVEGKIVKGYDDAIISGDKMRSEMYGGISVAAKIGTEVKAGEAGVVDEVKNNDVMFGTTVVIKHTNGVKTEYCNLDTNLKVKKGDNVTKGQVIGKVGKTAQSLGASLKCEFLHIRMYELKDKEYKEIDPGKYFSFKK